MNQAMFLTNNSTKKAPWAIVLAFIITALLYAVPFLYPLAYPFMLLSTLVHEMGHGIAAVLVGGEFVSFKMWLDGSGVAQTTGQFGRISQAFISASGLVGPALVAAVAFYFLNSQKACRIFLGCMSLICALAILLVVRNFFGIIFVAGVCALCWFFSLGPLKTQAQNMQAILATELSLSVFSRADYLFTKTAQTTMGPMPSDVAQIAQALFLPYWLWGTLCALFSLGVLAFGLRQVFK